MTLRILRLMKLQSLGGNDDGEVRQGAAFRADREAYLKKGQQQR